MVFPSARVRFGVLVLHTFAALALSAAPKPPAELFTAKERAQGFSDRAILAKPLAGRRVRVDGDEAREGVRVREQFHRLGGLRVIEVEPGDSVETAMARLRATGRYEFVEPDYIQSPDAIPNDPGFPAQWSLLNTGQIPGGASGADIAAPAAWDIIHDAPNVIVAMIDDGVAPGHPDLAPNLWVNPSPTFGDIHGARIIRGLRSGDIDDDSGHGTKVAGIIGAAGNNATGITGVAWRVQLMILKHSAGSAGSTTSDSAACIDYAVAHGAHIINCSFGSAQFSQAMLTAIRAARNAGVIVVASAGNDGANLDASPHYPASYLSDNVVAVGNSGPADAASPTSGYGAAVELFAPGTSIPSLDHANPAGTRIDSGTSFSAPHVTGALVLLKARFPSDTHLQLINRLLGSVDVKSPLAGRALTNGRLNLRRAVTSTSHRPFNDDFAQRAIVSGAALALRANNADATTETGEPAHAGLTPEGTLWWQWIAPSSSTVAISTLGSAYDTTLAVYTGTSLSGLAAVAADDNGGANGTSRVSFVATSGISYAVAVSGRAGARGYTQLNVALAPANDSFANAIVLAGESAQVSARNNAATGEPGEPSILGFGPTATLWYQWTAPRTSRFQVSAFTTDFDPLLAVYSGSALNALTLVAASDDTTAAPGLENRNSRCTIEAVAGTTYFIQADTKSNAVGTVHLTITDSLWQFSTGGNAINSAAAVGPDGTLYFGTPAPDNRLYAVKPDGTSRWVHAAAGGFDYATPSIAADGSIYFGDTSGKLTALTAAGTVRWTRNLGASASNSPALAADGTLYLHDATGFLHALNAADGSSKWQLDIGATNTSASAVIATDGTIYQGSNDGRLRAINPNGTPKWQYDAGSSILSTPALDAAGNIYFGTHTTSRVISLTPGGTLRWSYSGVALGSAIGSSPTLSADGGTVYVTAADRKLHALSSGSGAMQWTYTAGHTVFGSTPAIDHNGVIYFGAYDGRLYAINPNGTLKRTWDTAQAISASPRIFGTTLYIPSSDAKLYALDLGAFAGGGPWPQFRHNVRNLGRSVLDPPYLATAPLAQSIPLGGAATLQVAALGQGPLAYQWTRNGSAITGATASSLTIASAEPASVGLYAARISSNGGATTSPAAIVGVNSTAKLVGSGTEFPDVVHPITTFTYDQILLGAAAASATADAGQILRMSFIDLSNDIVQVELSGAGTLSLVLDSVTGPAPPQNYTQAIAYLKGHAGIVLSGANATTNLSIFSVGRAIPGSDPGLYRSEVAYDGVADVAFIAISSTDGSFGGLRTGNASYFGTKGLTGLYAPGVAFTGPVFVGDIRASDEATPVLQIGSGSDVRITGGDLLQDNGRAVQVSGFARLRFTDGTNSHGVLLPQQGNRARLEQNGADVTAQIIIAP